MYQDSINRNVDYLNKMQKDETDHQNHRLSWILAAQSILFVGICSIAAGEYAFTDVIAPLIILIGILLSISGLYSIIISETSIGIVYEKWFDYDHQRKCSKNKPIPHMVSLAPPFFLRSGWKFLMFYKFAPSVLCASWIALLLFYIDTNTKCIDIFTTSCAVILTFFILLILICVVVQMLCDFSRYRWRYDNFRSNLERSNDARIDCCPKCPENSNGPDGPRCSSMTVNIDLGRCKRSDLWCENSKWKIYHIMIDRFNGDWPIPPQNSKDYIGGTIRGIINKLSYIKQNGYNAIMLTPLFKGESYHGYHITDYDMVDPSFGTWEEFEDLVSKAHCCDIKIICDFVPNHCHINHKFFKKAQNNPKSRYRDWFYFDDSRLGGYVSYQNYPDLPKFNLYNPDAANYMIDIAQRLVKDYKIDGLRIDHTIGVPFAFLRELIRRVKALNPDVFIFGEVWPCNIRDVSQIEFISAERKQEFMRGDADIQDKMQNDYVGILDGVLDFTYMNIMTDTVCGGQRIWRNEVLDRRICQHFMRYPRDFQLLLFLDNHDTNRFLYYCNGDNTLLQEAINYTMDFPYSYLIYYGTEQEMCNKNSIFDGTPDADLEVRYPMRWV